MAESKLSVYDFGRQLLATNDLDPIYCMLWEAQLDKPTLERWLLAYWCFYHPGTASWIADLAEGYWDRFMRAALSKEYPRCPERRHFRGENAIKSTMYLRDKGLEKLFAPFYRGGWQHAQQLMDYVQTWVGFGPWISFKVADMLERLGIVDVLFDKDTAIYKGSPTDGAILLHELEAGNSTSELYATDYAVDRILWELDTFSAPPRHERRINLQEVETILCKWKSYMGGHYELGEDVRSLRRNLLQFSRSPLVQRLLRACSNAKLGG